MYESFFAFEERPFVAAPSPQRYFAAECMEQIRRNLTRVIERAEGPGLIIGAAGAGKTLLCHVLADQFRNQFLVAMLACTKLRNRRTLLQNILFELNLPYRNMEEGELRLSLMDHLKPGPDCPNGLLLLIDEAHTQPTQLLEEVRMITNFVRDGRPRVRLILAGCPLLEERLASPKLELLNQRLAARCYLQSFHRQEAADYVRWRVSTAGGADDIFSNDALEAVYRATEGVPRLINQVCDHALRLAAAAQLRQVGPAQVEEAWADLQQLPMPCQGAVREASADTGGVLEFGQLDDFDEAEEDDPAPSDGKRNVADDDELEPAQPLDPCEQIENIELRVAEIRSEDATSADCESDEAASVPPAPCEERRGSDESETTEATDGPEVELIFHDVSNPFDEPFEEEEVVLDRYTSLEAATTVGWPAVSGPESQQLAAALTALEMRDEPDPRPAATPEPMRSDPAPPSPKSGWDDEPLEATARPEAATAPSDVHPDARPPSGSADDQHAPCALDSENDASDHEEPVATLAMPRADRDDRDILIVEEDEIAPLFSASAGGSASRVRRREYSQLFAKLRRG